MNLISHRGIHNSFIKENTYEGIYKAFMNDLYIGVEFDIRETKDNKFILFHEPLLNNKLISKYKYKDLDDYIPLLEDILKINTKKIFLIEIKNIKSYDKLIHLLHKYKDKTIYVMSFSSKKIKKMNVISRKYKIGLLNYVLNTDDFINELDFVCILNKLLSEELTNILNNKIIFSYGITTNYNYKNIYYIVDN